MRMGFAKFAGCLDKPRNGNEIPPNGLNFPNLSSGQVICTGTGGRGFSGNLKVSGEGLK